ncbi:MAG: alpha/beta hydrolase [Proteobacteria bacterium]|nr:alpha/beta hydrolase [Pseudomonadota bacterium]
MAKIKLENGLTFYYEIEGQGDVVALVQGLDRDHTGMRFQRKELAKHFQVVTYDARGTGLSETPEGPYTCRQMADDLYFLLRALGINKAHIIGASMGGVVAQEFALAYPEMTGCLILFCTYSKSDHFTETLVRFWITAVEKTGHALLCEGIMPWLYTREFFETQQMALDWARQVIREQEPYYSIKGFQWKAEAALAADTADRLHLITAPTLVVAGAEDMVVPPALCEKLARSIQGAQFKIISGGAHAFFDEKPFEVNEILLNFLTTL